MPFSDAYTFRAFQDPGPSWTPARTAPTGYGSGYGGGGGGGYAPGSLTGAGTQAGSGPYGAVPRVPDPTVTTRNALQGNLTNMRDLINLSGQLNTANQNQLSQMYGSVLPGLGGALSTSMENIQSNLQGKIDPNVMRQFQQDAAERGGAIGSINAGNVDSNYLTNVLRNRLALQKQGQEQLSNRITTAPVAKPFDTSSMLISPSDMFNAQMGANIYAAAPNPAAAAAAARANFNQGLGYGAGAGGGGGGVYRGPAGFNTSGGGSQLYPVGYSTGTETVGGEGGNISQQDWWNSIGYGAGGGGGNNAATQDYMNNYYSSYYPPGGGMSAGEFDVANTLGF